MPRNDHEQSEYVGLNPSGSQDGETPPPPTPPLPQSRITTYIQVAVCLVVIRMLYAFHKPLALLAFVVFGILAAYRLNAQSQQAIEEHNRHMRNMERINREREDSEAMVAEAARMMMDINKRHLEEFLVTRPQATYEQWIASLHPENVENGTIVDHRFYVHDSDHRLLWNEMVPDKSMIVPARSLKDAHKES